MNNISSKISENSHEETSAELPSFFNTDYVLCIKEEYGKIENYPNHRDFYSPENTDNSSKNIDYPDHNSKTPWFRHTY